MLTEVAEELNCSIECRYFEKFFNVNLAETLDHYRVSMFVYSVIAEWEVLFEF